MKTTAVRLHGACDLRLSTFELPEITADEALMRVVSDSLCASTYKAYKQGAAHKRVPDNVADMPVIVGHEMSGELVAVGANLAADWKVGDRVIIQPALKLANWYDPGYSYPYIGGAATYVVVPKVVFERGCLLPFAGDSHAKGSLVESIGCVVRGYKGMYHINYDDFSRTDGAKRGGKIAILGGAGPMGLAAAALAGSYAGCSMAAVVDIDEARLAFASRRFPSEASEKFGCKLHYVNTKNMDDPAAALRELADGGFDDVLVMVPVPELFTLAEAICGEDGCINFFAGPADHGLMGSINLYRIHYDGIHVVGTAGSNPADTVDTIRLIEEGKIDPSIMISHICGLPQYADAVRAFEKPFGAKKVCYNHIDLPMTAIDDLAELGKTDPMMARLAELVAAHGGLWNAEAEAYLLANAKKVDA